jgi:inositol transport system substrate-binding protein
MKKVFLAVMVALALTGTLSAQGKVYKVAYIARAQADSFAAWLANSIVDEAKKYKNIDLKVFDGQANDDTENSLIENAITNKFDVIIVQPNNGE